MGKLILELDALKVESFATAGSRDAAGTIRGHGDTFEGGCEGDGDSEVSCPAGCSALCSKTCNSFAEVCCANDN